MNNLIEKINLYFLDKLTYYKVKEQNVISYGLILNAFSLLSLMYKEFTLFILLFVTSLYCTVLFKKYSEKNENENKKLKYYSNFADYVKILSTYVVFSKMYEKKININIIIITTIILILCNINFTIENILDKTNKDQSEFIKLWNKTLSWIDEDKLQKINNFTQFFSEEFIMVYVVLIMIYIHNKK